VPLHAAKRIAINQRGELVEHNVFDAFVENLPVQIALEIL
jgi:hypothetical protein